MPFYRIRCNWHITVKTPHTFHLYIREGFFNDKLELHVDDAHLFTVKAGLSKSKGYELFEVDGRTHELRWKWSMLTGNPDSILIMHKDRILAQYGSDRAAQDDILKTSES